MEELLEIKYKLLLYLHFLEFLKKLGLELKPNNKMVNLRCCEIHELKNDKIVESHILIDVIDLIFQTGFYPINKSRGAEGNWLNPINADGVNHSEKDLNISKAKFRTSTNHAKKLKH